MKARFVSHEQHIRAIAVLGRMAGLLTVVAVVALVALLPKIEGEALFLGVLGVSLIAVGQFLWSYHAWARWAAVALSGLTIVLELLPSGSNLLGRGASIVYSVATILVLVTGPSGEIFTADYRALVGRDRATPIRFWRSPFFFVPLGLLALLGVVLAGLVALASPR